MKFMCLMYCEGKRFDEMSKAEMETFQADCRAFDQELTKKGYFRDARALEDATTAATVRIRNEKMSVTDGPFAETKELLCGFVLIEAADREEAVRAMEGSPFAKIGSVEVRPVMDF